jgi:hypothetical protein
MGGSGQGGMYPMRNINETINEDDIIKLLEDDGLDSFH